MVQKTIQHGGDGGTIAEQLSPVFNGSVRCDQRAGSLVASHDDFQQFLGGGQRQLAHSQVVDDKKRHSGEQFHVLLPFAIQCGVSQLFQQDVRFSIQHAIALLDDCVPDGLGAVTLTASSRPRDMMHITLRLRLFTTAGIRFTASLCECFGG